MIHGNKYDNLFQQNRVNHMKNEIELRQDEIKEYILLISHVGKDENIALQIVAAIEEKNKDFEVTDKIRIIPIYMEKEVDSCHGDFIKWSAEAVERADGVLAIITKIQLRPKQRLTDILPMSRWYTARFHTQGTNLKTLFF